MSGWHRQRAATATSDPIHTMNHAYCTFVKYQVRPVISSFSAVLASCCEHSAYGSSLRPADRRDRWRAGSLAVSEPSPVHSAADVPRRTPAVVDDLLRSIYRPGPRSPASWSYGCRPLMPSLGCPPRNHSSSPTNSGWLVGSMSRAAILTTMQTRRASLTKLKVEAIHPMAFETCADVVEHFPHFPDEVYNRRRLHSRAGQIGGLIRPEAAHQLLGKIRPAL